MPFSTASDSIPELQSIRIFSGAAAVTLSQLNMACQQRRFDAGQSIFCEGEAAESVMLILEGEVKVTLYSPDGREVAIRRIGAGEIFGDYAAIDGGTRSADVEALTDVHIAEVSAQEFIHLVTADPAVAYAQIRELVAMVRRLSKRIFETTTLKASARLIHQLLELAEPGCGHSANIPNLPTHAEIAALISSHRHVVTSELSHLEADGLIRKGDKKHLHIPDVHALARQAGAH